jgi:hypothetical protein
MESDASAGWWDNPASGTEPARAAAGLESEREAAETGRLTDRAGCFRSQPLHAPRGITPLPEQEPHSRVWYPPAVWYAWCALVQPTMRSRTNRDALAYRPRWTMMYT